MTTYAQPTSILDAAAALDELFLEDKDTTFQEVWASIPRNSIHWVVVELILSETIAQKIVLLHILRSTLKSSGYILASIKIQQLLDMNGILHANE